MKTLQLIAVIAGLLSSGIALSFTTSNLPVNGIAANPVDKLLVFKNPEIYRLLDAGKFGNESAEMDDTMVIDLQKVVATQSLQECSAECLQRHVTYPEFAVKENLEGVVVVNIYFNQNGNVEIADSFATDPRLEQYVHQRLLQMQPKDCYVSMYKPYNLRFLFRRF
jgi:hypothetical protein